MPDKGEWPGKLRRPRHPGMKGMVQGGNRGRRGAWALIALAMPQAQPSSPVPSALSHAFRETRAGMGHTANHPSPTSHAATWPPDLVLPSFSSYSFSVTPSCTIPICPNTTPDTGDPQIISLWQHVDDCSFQPSREICDLTVDGASGEVPARAHHACTNTCPEQGVLGGSAKAQPKSLVIRGFERLFLERVWLQCEGLLCRIFGAPSPGDSCVAGV